MKYFWIGLLILLVLFSGCLASTIATHRYTEDALTALQQAFDLAEDGQFTESAALIEQASDAWDSHKGLFGIVLHHDESDAVNTDFQSTLQYAKKHDGEEFFGACAELMESIGHIRDMEVPHYYNVLITVS